MRRFSLMIFALAVLFAMVIGRKDDPARRNADQPTSADAKGLEPVEAIQAASDSSSVQAGQRTTPEQSGMDGALQQTSAVVERLPGAAGQASQSEYVTSAPVHVLASAKSGGIDPALEGLTGSDLTVAVQTELKRLGCYDAKIDGKWGRKSQAAVEAFSERLGGAWADVAPRQTLVAALRAYPAGYCTAECTAKDTGGQCAVTAAPKANESNEARTDTSYLPPWMQGKLTNIEPEPASVTVGEKTISDVAPLTSKPKKSKNARRRGGDGGRAAQRYQQQRFSNNNWRPRGWPGSR